MGEKLVLFKKQQDIDEELNDLLRTLSHTKREIELTYCHFNSTNDPDLIESYVYEISALQCRYNYLIRRIKEKSGTSAEHAFPGKEM